MSEAADSWAEGQHAWRRLAEWDRETERSDDGERALAALTDLGLVRRLLDRTEFAAVRTARENGKSWSEIAIGLGVTRQSAWERWRDIDDEASPEPAGEVPLAAREGRRRGTVKVPNVIGKSWDDARKLLQDKRLVAVAPDGRSMVGLTGPDSVVTDQSPESGARVAHGTRVTLWLERGGGSGVREPRRPKPDPKTGRKMRDEVTEETVG
ncbi:MAG TPA: PASTA domain-containing protein [Amycolatopsis sp.]|nr:PASTA domain-containing protein [Amycolatopsis sp.]